MKRYLSSIKSAMLLGALLFGASFSSNAELIEQDVLSDGEVVATFQVDVDTSMGGFISTFSNPGMLTLKGMEILGTVFSSDELDFALFDAAIDSDNLSAGLSVLLFDLQDPVSVESWLYQLGYDEIQTSGNFINVLDPRNGTAFSSLDISLSEARVVVQASAPATAILVLLGMGVAAFRRKA